MKLTDKAAVLEAVLFACGDPVDVERISAATGIEKGAISQLADSLNEVYAENGSSLVVLRLSGLYQLAVRREYYEYVKLAAETKKNAPLTPAAMEVLTIIAYNQPAKSETHACPQSRPESHTHPPERVLQSFFRLPPALPALRSSSALRRHIVLQAAYNRI